MDIECQTLSDSTIKILWFDNSVDSLMFNSDYLKSIPDDEKAAVAYVAMHDSRDCEWDGEPNSDQSNLNCKIIKALGLGYQCSPKYINLLTRWFRSDTAILGEIKYCPMTPNTAHQLHGIDEILLTKMSEKAFKIFYKASGVNISTMSYWSFSETIIFRREDDKLIVVNRKQGKVKRGRL